MRASTGRTCAREKIRYSDPGTDTSSISRELLYGDAECWNFILGGCFPLRMNDCGFPSKLLMIDWLEVMDDIEVAEEEQWHMVALLPAYVSLAGYLE